MKYKDCGCRDDDHQACPRCEGWSQAELDRMSSGGQANPPINLHKRLELYGNRPEDL